MTKIQLIKWLRDLDNEARAKARIKFIDDNEGGYVIELDLSESFIYLKDLKDLVEAAMMAGAELWLANPNQFIESIGVPGVAKVTK